MLVLDTVAALRDALRLQPRPSFVPTMGSLHEGHLSLIRHAAACGGPVVASIFVNRLQFAPGEDFERYPRSLDADCGLLRAAGCDITFAPTERELYPEPQEYRLHPPAALADILEGHVRPGFFTGVSTVVLKLFNIVQPRLAVFGKKDYQQLLVIRGLVRQCALPIEVVGAETVRDADGLALSSRNAYLSRTERIEAPWLHRELERIAVAIAAGERDHEALASAAQAALQRRGWSVDYLSVRRRGDLRTPEPGAAPSDDAWVVLGAARLGDSRLIDNVEVGPLSGPCGT